MSFQTSAAASVAGVDEPTQGFVSQMERRSAKSQAAQEAVATS
jgi:hypothetical protein